MIQATLTLSDDIKETLDAVATFRDKNPDAILLEAIENHLKHESEVIALLRERGEAMQKDKAEGNIISFNNVFEHIDQRIATAKDNA